jgi:hypothetical protein
MSAWSSALHDVAPGPYRHQDVGEQPVAIAIDQPLAAKPACRRTRLQRIGQNGVQDHLGDALSSRLNCAASFAAADSGRPASRARKPRGAPTPGTGRHTVRPGK